MSVSPIALALMTMLRSSTTTASAISGVATETRVIGSCVVIGSDRPAGSSMRVIASSIACARAVGATRYECAEGGGKSEETRSVALTERFHETLGRGVGSKRRFVPLC